MISAIKNSTLTDLFSGDVLPRTNRLEDADRHRHRHTDRFVLPPGLYSARCAPREVETYCEEQKYTPGGVQMQAQVLGVV